MIPLIVNHRNSIQSIKRLTIRNYIVVQLTNLDDIHLSTVALWNVTLSVPGTFLTCPLLIILLRIVSCDKGPYLRTTLTTKLNQPNLPNDLWLSSWPPFELQENCKEIARKCQIRIQKIMPESLLTSINIILSHLSIYEVNIGPKHNHLMLIWSTFLTAWIACSLSEGLLNKATRKPPPPAS